MSDHVQREQTNAKTAEQLQTIPFPKKHKNEAVSLTDFYAYMPLHRYIFSPTRDMWPTTSVNSRIEWPVDHEGKPIAPATWLDEHKPVEQMTWMPGEPMLIENKLIDTGGWIPHQGVTVFNLYRPPTIKPGNPHDIAPWLDHCCRIYGDDADHIVNWLAHRIQKPGEKINHALVLGGRQGIGKDTILEPVKYGVGPWNFKEVQPPALLGRFNDFVKSVILRISEARDLGEIDRFKFYDHTKTYIAAPPDVLRCDEKNLREHAVPNVMGVIITTNHKSDGIFLPADDRRHYVAWSDCDREEFTEEYWNNFWSWYQSGGIENVATFLATMDISGFDPKAPPPKTDAFWHIVNTSRAPEESELADILDNLGRPDVITLTTIVEYAEHHYPEFGDWLKERKNRRQIPHRMESIRYHPIRNQDANDGLFKIREKRQVVYGRDDLCLRDQLLAVRRLSQ